MVGMFQRVNPEVGRHRQMLLYRGAEVPNTADASVMDGC